MQEEESMKQDKIESAHFGGTSKIKSQRNKTNKPENGSIVYGMFEESNNWIWLRNLVTGLWIMEGIERTLKLYYDNKLAILYQQ